jgi:hypothetical protein
LSEADTSLILLHLLTTASGTKRTCRDVRYLSVFGGKADIGLTMTKPLARPACRPLLRHKAQRIPSDSSPGSRLALIGGVFKKPLCMSALSPFSELDRTFVSYPELMTKFCKCHELPLYL